MVSAFILSFSFTSPVSANFLQAGSGIISIPSPNNNVIPTPVYPVVDNNPSPVIYSINPNVTSVGDADITMTVTGADFISTSSVQWNGAYMPTSYVDQNHLTVALTSSSTDTAGSYSITVFNPAPGGGVSNIKYLNVEASQTSNGNLSVGGLSANALSAGFLPTNPLEWLLLFLIILLIVIIARKLMKKNKEASLTVLSVSTSSVTLGATGLIPNVIHVFEVTGALGSSNKVQLTAGKDGTANVSFANLTPNTHYTASVNKYNPATGLLTNVGIPVLYFDTLKQQA